MLLFVGLGNPGPRYALNRHNIGFMAVDAIAETHDFSPENEKKRFHGIVREGDIGAERVIALKPTTFMNDSGLAVVETMHFYKLDLKDLIVFHDEVDLAPGKLRVKQGGGAAGHNGIRSIMDHMGGDFCRIRLGVGHPGDRSRMSNHVLGDFSKAEQHGYLPEFLGAIAQAAPTLAGGRKDAFMSKVADEMRSITENGADNGL